MVTSDCDGVVQVVAPPLSLAGVHIWSNLFVSSEPQDMGAIAPRTNHTPTSTDMELLFFVMAFLLHPFVSSESTL